MCEPAAATSIRHDEVNGALVSKEGEHTDGITISVIVPTYNRADSLPECLDSILNQTRPADQIIVVDDGSSDVTQQIVPSYGDRITLVSQKNQGVSVARNAGLAMATSQWITFLDSDDTWTPDRLAVLERDVLAASDPFDVHWANLHITGTEHVWTLFDVKKLQAPCGRAIPLQDAFPHVLTGTSPQSLACRRELAEDIGGFMPWARISGDTHFAARLALAGSWVITGDVVADVKRRQGTQAGLRQQADADPIWRAEMGLRLLEDIARKDLSDTQWQALSARIALYHLDHAEALAASGDRPAARRALMRSLKSRRGSLKNWIRVFLPMVIGPIGFRIVNMRRNKYQRG